MKYLLLSLLLIGGCGSTDDPAPDPDSDTDPTLSDDDDDDTTNTTFVGAQDCPWAGTWLMTSPRCDNANYGDWKNWYTTTTLVIEHNPVRGCDMTFSLSGDRCAETEEWYADVDEGQASVLIDAKGITSCDPEACQFSGSDGPCEIGARDNEMDVIVDSSVPDILDFTWLATYAAPTCNGVLKLGFERQ